MEKKGEKKRKEKQGMALSRTRHVTGGLASTTYKNRLRNYVEQVVGKDRFGVNHDAVLILIAPFPE